MSKPEILFDHFYIVVSREHYQAIKNDPVWSRFFVRSYESTVRTGEGNEWTGFYSSTLNCRYVEVFYEGPRINEGYVTGAGGIGLCSEEIGVTEKLRSFYESHCKDQHASVVPRTYASQKLNRNISWFTYFMPPMLNDPFLKTWVMDYHAEFLGVAQVPMKDSNHYDRERFNPLPELTDDHPKVKSIQSIRVACKSDEIEIYRRHLIGLAFEQMDGFTFRLPEFTLFIQIADTVQSRITEVTFELDRECMDFEHRIGDKSLLTGKHLSLTWKTTF